MASRSPISLGAIDARALMVSVARKLDEQIAQLDAEQSTYVYGLDTIGDDIFEQALFASQVHDLFHPKGSGR